mmetsp:Transcript_443/g.740  ORF Transcript_443/g.740 Transcript_443/m.740 type:complete len:265 (+) Transcript_443:188-982(+)
MASIDLSQWNEIRNIQEQQEYILQEQHHHQQQSGGSWEVPLPGSSGGGMVSMIPSHHQILTGVPAALQISSMPHHHHQHLPIGFLTTTPSPNVVPLMTNHASPHHQQAQHISLEIAILEREFPLVYTLLVKQQAIIDEQKVEIENKTKEVARLNAELVSRLKSRPKKTQNKDDTIPPVIVVEKDGHSLISGKGGGCGRGRALTSSSSGLEGTAGQYTPSMATSTDSDHCDSLPLKKRRRETDSDSKQKLSNVIRILGAATKSSV